MTAIAISAIDTDAGKTLITGVMAKYLLDKNINVITQKIAQTGCVDSSEDIEAHREMMDKAFPEDKEGLTCPYIFPLPASPHLSAAQCGRKIEVAKIESSLRILEGRYELVLQEGVGGLMVPFNSDDIYIDCIKQWQLPMILVTSAKLGSINHTLLSLEAIKARGIQLLGLVYNGVPESSPEIKADSINVFSAALKRLGYPEVIVEVPKITDGNFNVDFGPLFSTVL